MDDLEAIMVIDRASFPTPSKASLLEYEISQNKLARYQVLTMSAKHDECKIIGFAGYWLIADGVHISTIAVTPSCRGRGLGELLLLNILFLANARAGQMATLEVRENNQEAQALYMKYQFEFVGRRKGYYRDTGEDALLMTVAALDAQYYQMLNQKREALFLRLAAS
jgi:ribosomal-protein-alanine N-acetyltransferase